MTDHPIHRLITAIAQSIQRKTKAPAVTFHEAFCRASLQVSPDDQGRFIGKAGKVIWAIKTLVWYAGMAHLGQPCDLQLLEPNNPGKRSNLPFKPNPKWDDTKVSQLAVVIGEVCFRQIIPWVLEKTDETKATLEVQLEKYLQAACSDPDLSFEDAFSTVIHAAGMAQGASVRTVIHWK